MKKIIKKRFPNLTYHSKTKTNYLTKYVFKHKNVKYIFIKENNIKDNFSFQYLGLDKYFETDIHIYLINGN